MIIDQIIPHRTYQSGSGDQFRVDCIVLPKDDNATVWVSPISESGRPEATRQFNLAAFAALMVRQL